MAYQLAIPFHAGEREMHRKMKVPDQDNSMSPMLTPQAANMLQKGPLLALGTIDEQGRPWTTIWGGETPLAQPLGQNMIGIRSMVDTEFDPVVKVLFGDKHDEDQDVTKGGKGKMVAGLTLDLNTRKRVKIYGRMVAGGLVEQKPEKEGDPILQQAQLVLRIDQSLGNCPKYLNCKTITPVTPHPKLISEAVNLPQKALDIISNSDLFFLSSSHSTFDMDANHRGGPVGFVRTSTDATTGATTLVWPEYSGNRLYQTLGNLHETPRAGLVFPNFITGDVLYLTGTTEILVGPAASAVIPRINLAVRLTVTASKLVSDGLVFRGEPGESSPYNPRVRPLASEAGTSVPESNFATATLQEVTRITPTISRYKFNMPRKASWQPGGWVAFDFSDELDVGYSHMRNDDPQSLNDDFVRTFTVSSAPKEGGDEDFEVTIRNVGAVTGFLAKQKAKFEVPIKGFGGGLKIDMLEDGKRLGFVAGGVGITPLLGQLQTVDPQRLRLFWTVSNVDVDLVLDVLTLFPALAQSTSIFITGTTDGVEKQVEKLQEAGVDQIETRRLQKDDLVNAAGVGNTWHACVSGPLRKVLLDWLSGKEVLYEDFNF